MFNGSIGPVETTSGFPTPRSTQAISTSSSVRVYWTGGALMMQPDSFAYMPWIMPPSMMNSVPFMYSESSEARNSANLATSTASAIRP